MDKDSHPWRIIVDNEKALVQWCPYCGAIRKEAKEKHDGVHTTVTYPSAWGSANAATCALMRLLR